MHSSPSGAPLVRLPTRPSVHGTAPPILKGLAGTKRGSKYTHTCPHLVCPTLADRSRGQGRIEASYTFHFPLPPPRARANIALAYRLCYESSIRLARRFWGIPIHNPFPRSLQRKGNKRPALCPNIGFGDCPPFSRGSITGFPLACWPSCLFPSVRLAHKPFQNGLSCSEQTLKIRLALVGVFD